MLTTHDIARYLLSQPDIPVVSELPDDDAHIVLRDIKDLSSRFIKIPDPRREREAMKSLFDSCTSAEEFQAREWNVRKRIPKIMAFQV